MPSLQYGQFSNQVLDATNFIMFVDSIPRVLKLRDYFRITSFSRDFDYRYPRNLMGIALERNSTDGLVLLTHNVI